MKKKLLAFGALALSLCTLAGCGGGNVEAFRLGYEEAKIVMFE